MKEMIDFDKLIEKYLYREVRQRTLGRYYPSEIGQCLRKSWFNIKMPKPVDPEVMKIFEAGNLFHEFVVKVLKSDKNPEIELIADEMPLKYKIDNFEISGRIDDIIQLKYNGERILIEVKSVKSLDVLKEPSEAYVMQIQFYMHVTNIKKGALLYIEKNSLRSKTFFIDYDIKTAEMVIEKFRELHNSVTENSIPKPEAKLNYRKKWMCNFCAYKNECDGIEQGQQ